MKTETPQLVISGVFDAPRELVYRAFTDPDHLAAWWGTIGNSLPRDEIDFDARPGGYQRWTEINPAEPGLRVHIHVDLTDVADGELLEGVMHVSGRLREGIEPFETRLRVEFHDEADGRTRLEIRQWLPEHLAHLSEEGWRQAFAKPAAALVHSGHARVILVSGDGGRASGDEPAVMTSYLTERLGVDSRRVVADPFGLDT